MIKMDTQLIHMLGLLFIINQMIFCCNSGQPRKHDQGILFLTSLSRQFCWLLDNRKTHFLGDNSIYITFGGRVSMIKGWWCPTLLQRCHFNLAFNPDKDDASPSWIDTIRSSIKKTHASEKDSSWSLFRVFDHKIMNALPEFTLLISLDHASIFSVTLGKMIKVTCHDHLSGRLLVDSLSTV